VTGKQKNALNLMRQARREDPTTDDGVATDEATFYDSEVHVAYVHWQTARALKDRGLLEFIAYDPEWGTSLRLTEQT